MKLKIIMLLLTTMLLNDVHSQLLWKISRDDNPNVSYIFGTHHLIDTSQLRNFSHVLDLVGKSNVVVGEIDLATPNMQDTILKYALLDGDSIHNYLLSSEYCYLDTSFKKLSGLKLANYDCFKPMYISSLYTNQLYNRNFCDTQQGVTIDVVIQEHARKLGKKIVGLETVGEQAYILFGAIPIQRQVDILMNEVKKEGENIKAALAINKAYIAGDMLAIERLDLEDQSSTKEEKLMINDRRNERWLKSIEKLIESDSCFIAVGFLHFTGAKGLICSLDEMGYAVVPVIL